MKEIPVLFSTPMVRAILDGTKTQTRRVIKPQPLENTNGYLYKGAFWGFGEIVPQKMIQYAPYKPGDILWMRETWTDECNMLQNALSGRKINYCADCNDDPYGIFKCVWKKKPSIHMPRKAARIFLEIKSVRVERLQEITEEDAKKEGSYLGRCDCPQMQNNKTPLEAAFIQHSCHIHGDEFKYLWDSLNAKRGYSWESSPWVWVVEFVRVERKNK